MNDAFKEDGVPPVQQVGSNLLVHSDSASWANNDAQDTTHTTDITLPKNLQRDAKYLLIIDNPSAESDIAISFQNAETLNGATAYAEAQSSTVAKGTTKAIIVDGWMLGTAARLSLSNSTLIGAAGAFTAYFTVRKV